MEQHHVRPTFKNATNRLPSGRERYLAGTGPPPLAVASRVFLLDQNRTSQVSNQQLVPKSGDVDRARRMLEALESEASTPARRHRQQRAARQPIGQVLGGKKLVHPHPPVCHDLEVGKV